MSTARQARVATVLAVAIILGAGYAAYSDSFRGPFLFDDVESIPGNPTIRQLSPIWPILTSRHTATVIGRPLLSLSLAISYALHGEEVRGYHQFSLIVHLLCGLLLFGLVRRTQTRSP